MSSALVRSINKLELLQQLANSIGVTAPIEIAEGYPSAFQVGSLIIVSLRDSTIEVRSGQQVVGPLYPEPESYLDVVSDLGLTVNGTKLKTRR